MKLHFTLIPILLLNLLGFASLANTPNQNILRCDGSIDLNTCFEGPVNLEGRRILLDPVNGPLVLPAFAAAGWNAFSSPPLSDQVNTIVVNGSYIYVGGQFNNAGGNTDADKIARWNGTSWEALGVNGDIGAQVHSIAISGSDVYVGGAFDNAAGIAAADGIARWDGSNWNSLGATGLNGTVFSIVIDGSDVYVGGNFTDAGGDSNADRIVRWDGSAWNALASGLGGGVEAVAVDATYVYAGGSFLNAGGVDTADHIARWNKTTELWSAMGAGTGASVNAIVVDGTDIYIGGTFNNAGNVTGANKIARWDGSAWNAMGVSPNTQVHAIVVAGGNVYAGGTFTTASGNTNCNKIAYWDGSVWNPLNTGLSTAVHALAYDNCNIYVGGSFNNADGIEDADKLAIWENIPGTTLYADTDGDGFGDPANDTITCLPISGYVADNTDLCPNDPLKIAPGVCGCGIPEGSCGDCNLVVTATSPDIEATCGDLVTIDLEVSNSFIDIIGYQFSVNWDETQLEYVDHDSLDIGGEAPVIGIGNVANGELTYTWASAGLGETLANGTVVMSITLRAIGSTGSAVVDVTDSPLAAVFTDETFTCVDSLITPESDVDIALMPIDPPTCPTDQMVCTSELPLDLTALGATPGGGSFSGTGVSGDEFSASAGSYTITYTYTDGNGCSNTCEFDITVNDLPDVTCPVDQEICISELPLDLTSLGATPMGGTFSGTGVSGDEFDEVSGTYTITYTYTDMNGCTDSCSFDITVNDLPVVTCPVDQEICISELPLDLTSLGATPIGGTFSGTGVSGDEFDEVAGTYTITYTYTDMNGCTDSCSFDITVNDLPVVTCPEGQEVCISELPFDLTSLSATPMGGTFSGTGVSGNNFSAVAGNYIITYTYTDGNNCTDSCSFGITVQALPILDCPVDQEICISELPLDLTSLGATPMGGTFSGTGVSGDDFDEDAGTYTITYTYTDMNGCTDSCSFDITVNDLPVLSCPTDQEICISELPLDLTSLGATPMGGTFSGTGVSGDEFDEDAGTYTITYTYTDMNGCTDSCSFDITVNDLPVLTCPTYPDDICINEPAFPLSGGLPGGGTYSGPGVSLGNFDPMSAGAGTHSITYTYTDGNGCTDSCSFDIDVIDVPACYCGDVCMGPVTFVGNITITTQTQMTAFVDGSNCKYTHVTGNLILVGNDPMDPISNMCNLTELQMVGGDLIIRQFTNPANPTDLSDLSNLTTIGDGVGVDNLVIGGSLANQNTQFVAIELVALQLVGNGSVTITHNPNASLVDIELVALQLVGTNLDIHTNGNTITNINIGALQSTGNNLILNNNVANQVNAVIDLGSLTSVGNNFTANRTASSIDISLLESIGNNLTLNNNSFTTLSAPLLDAVAGNISIDNNTLLTSISIPTDFVAGSGSLSATGNSTLQSLSIGILSTTGNVNIQTNGSGVTSVALGNLQSVGNALTMNNAAAHDISTGAVVDLSALLSVTGNMILTRAVNSFSAPLPLTTVGGNFTFSRNAITNLDVDFPVFASVGVDLTVTNNTNLGTCCIIPCQLVVGGTTTVSGNTGNCLDLAVATAFCVEPTILVCPDEQVEIECQTQMDINDAFDTWLAEVSASGGTNGILTSDWDSLTYPNACGDTVTINWQYEVDCGTPLSHNCSATFIVTPTSDVVLDCPMDATEAACQDQDAINIAFSNWLDSFDHAGGCNSDGSFDGMPEAPDACGGFTTVTYRVSSDCEADVTCERTFTVTAADIVVLDCPIDATEAACQDQTVIDMAFSDWLGSFDFSGGCNASDSFDGMPEAPDACGGSITVTYRVSSDCEADVTCERTFTVTAPDTVALDCPDDAEEAACQDQTAIDAAFAAWLLNVSFSGGCNATISDDNTGAPDADGGSTTVTWTVTSDCEDDVICSATFTVLDGDVDDDGYRTCDGDCDDNDDTVYPGAPELCDGKDNDCDTVVDEGIVVAVPSGFAVLVLTPTSVLIDWPDAAGADNYQLRYRIQGTIPWTTVTVPISQATLVGLLMNNVYQYQVRARCGTDNASAWSGTQTFFTSTCGIPTLLTAMATGPTTATATWTAVTDAVYYIIRYRKPGFGWTVTSSPITTINITGLMASTTYEIQVATLCSGGVGAWSNLLSFTTPASKFGVSGSFEEENPVGSTGGLMEWVVYPNPLALGQELTIASYSTGYWQYEWQIIDIQGKLVHRAEWTMEEGYNALDLSQLTLRKGVYFISILTENGPSTKRLVVQ